MTIKRNGKLIKLTDNEVFAAHKEFVCSWFIGTAKEILDYNPDIPEKDYVNIGKLAYDIYSDGNGLTEYESLMDSVDKYKEAHNI